MPRELLLHGNALFDWSANRGHRPYLSAMPCRALIPMNPTDFTILLHVSQSKRIQLLVLVGRVSLEQKWSVLYQYRQLGRLQPK